MIILRIMALPGAEDLNPPAYASAGAAGLDLRAAVDCEIKPGERVVVPTGLAIALSEGYEAQVRPRSGLAVDHGITVLNAPGTIDSDYRGEIKVPLINHGSQIFLIRRGDRIAQMVVAPVTRVKVQRVEQLDETERGAQGFGSSGRL